METILEVALSNTAVAALLGLLLVCAGRFVRRPGALHLLWLLVLLKLVTPPVWRLPVIPAPVGATPEPTRSSSAALANSAAQVPPLSERRSTPARLETRDTADPAPAMLPSVLEPGTSPIEAGDSSDSCPPTEETAADDAAAGSIAEVPPWHGSRPAAWAVALPSIRKALLLVWAAGSVLWLMLAVHRVVRFRQMLRLARPAPPSLIERVGALAAELGLRQTPEVRLVAGCLSPCVWALAGRPILVLPVSLWGRLDAEQQGALLLHELAHLRRRDPLVRLLELAATAAHWWNPVLWWARRRLHEAEEQCCDAWVVHTRPGSASAYATALVETLDFLSGARAVPSLRTVPLGASGLGRLQHVSRRITMIMKSRQNPAPGRFGGMLALGLGALLLPLWPTWAKPQAPAEPAATGQPLALLTTAEAAAEPPVLQDRAPEATGSISDADDSVEMARSTVEIQRARLKKADAYRRQAMSTLARMKQRNVRVPGAIGEEEMEKAQAGVESAEADVEIAQAELKQAELKLARAERARVPLAPTPATDARAVTKSIVGQVESRRPGFSQGADRARAIKSLRQLTLALHNYANQHDDHYPPVATRTKDGKPALSWRVLVLPYLEQEALYRQFHLDEPWDSEHNEPLVAKMPAVFLSHDAAQGSTRFRAVAGEGTLWDKPEGVGLADILDGTSNTVALIESKHVIPWTAPDESPADGRAGGVMHPEIQLILKEGVIAAMADGSVRTMRPRMFEDWKALCSRAGGEILDFSRFDPAAQDEAPDPNPRPTGARTRGEAAPQLASPRSQAEFINLQNLKQIMLAMHNYASANGDRFPPIAKGTPDRLNLSWRVLILPYLEQEALYRQFHLDEPWDSPNNKPLIERMPAVYQTPGDPAGTTRFKGVMGLGGQGRETFWGYPEGVRIFDITDGTSNTIAVVEGREPVAWTKPEDLALDQRSPELEALFAQGFLAATADGAVHRISNDGPDRTVLLRGLFTRNGGEVIDWNQFGAMQNANPPQTRSGGGVLGGLFGGGVAAERERQRALFAAQVAERARAEMAAAEAERRRADKMTQDLQEQINQLRKENDALRKQLEESRKDPTRR